MKRKSNNFNKLIFRSLSLVVCITLVLVFSLMPVFASSTFTKDEYLASLPFVYGSVNVETDEQFGRLKGIIHGRSAYDEDFSIGVMGAGVVPITERPHNAWGIVTFHIDDLSKTSYIEVSRTVNELSAVYGANVDGSFIYPTDNDISISFNITVDNSSGINSYLSPWCAFRFYNAYGKLQTVEYEFLQLYVDDVLIRDFAVEPPTMLYYTYNVPYGSYLHIDLPDGGTVQTTVKTAKNVGSYISYPKFDGLRISYDNNNLNSYGYSRATNIALTPVGSKGNLGGANVFESDWLSVANSVNIYNGFDDEFSTNYSVQVTVYASNPKVVWYSPTTTSEVVSGDYSAVTNTGGAVNLVGGNGSATSPYYVTPTNNDGGRVDYAEIGTNPQGNEITQSLAEQIISVFTVPVQAMNDIVSGSKDFMSALSGLYSWLPEELRAPVAGAFTTILTIGVIKVLL